MSTKIHATVDALGNPTGFFLTGGQASDLAGADALLPTIAAPTLIADRGYDAEARVLAPLREAGKTAVIPPKRKRKSQREYDRDLSGARHRIEHGDCRKGAGRHSRHPTPLINPAATARSPGSPPSAPDC